METWQERARARMAELGITQEALIDTLCVKTRGAVGHYLTGRREPSIDQMRRLADRLDMSLDELVTGKVAYDGTIIAHVVQKMRTMEPRQQYLAARLIDQLDAEAPENER